MISMDIHNTKKGDWITYSNLNNGSTADKDRCEELLQFNCNYEVESISVSDFKTDVYLIGFWGRFNSVMFNNVGA